MAVTNGLALPIPELTDTADGPDAISDLANAVEDYVYDRILPTGVTRYPTHHWGSGTGFPSAGLPKAGDTYLHNGLGCMMRYNGTAWRQAEMTTVSSSAARIAISDNYSTLLHQGFEVYNSDTGNRRQWDSGAWRYTGRPSGEHPMAIAARTANLAWGAGAGGVYGLVQQTNQDSSMFATVAGTSIAQANIGGIRVLEAGRYHVSVHLGFVSTSAHSLLLRPYFQNVAGGYGTKMASIQNGIGSGGAHAANLSYDLSYVDDFWLPADQLVGIYLLPSPTAGTTLNYGSVCVQRIP